jgi:ankyrin repeat protein
VATDASAANNTALHHAADAAHRAVCEVLLDHDAPVDALNDARDTPLHVATARGHIDVCELLIDHQADVLAVNGAGDAPLHIAVATDRCDVAALLLDFDALVDARDAANRTPLFVAAVERRNVDMCRLLLERRADVDASCGATGTETALHRCAMVKLPPPQRPLQLRQRCKR